MGFRPLSICIGTDLQVIQLPPVRFAPSRCNGQLNESCLAAIIPQRLRQRCLVRFFEACASIHQEAEGLVALDAGRITAAVNDLLHNLRDDGEHHAALKRCSFQFTGIIYHLVMVAKAVPGGLAGLRFARDLCVKADGNTGPCRD